MDHSSFLYRYSELLFCIFACLFSWLSVPFFIHDDYSSFLFSMAAKQYSDYSLIDWYFLGFVGVNQILKILYGLYQDISWMGVAHFAQIFLGLFLLLKAFKTTIGQANVNPWVILIAQFFVSIVFLEMFVVISHTRASLLLCGISIYLILFSGRLTVYQYIALFLVFLTGMLFRLESSMGMIAIISTGFFLIEPDIRKYIKRISPIVVCVFLSISGIIFYWYNTDKFLIKVEPEVEYMILSGYMVDIETQKTPEDSVKYMAARNGMWFDPDVLTADYLRSIITPASPYNTRDILQSLIKVFQFYDYFSTIATAILCCMVILLLQRKYRILLSVIAFNGSVVALLCFLSINSGVETRHVLPILLITLLINCRMFFENANFKKLSHPLTWSALLLIFIYTSRKDAERQINLHENAASIISCAEDFTRFIDDNYKDRILVVTLAGNTVFDKRFSLKESRLSNNTYILYDMFNYSLVDSYREYLSRLCNCDARRPDIFFQWLADKKALYITDDDRSSLTEDYMRIIHHLPLKFENDIRVREIAPCLPDYEYDQLKIKKVTLDLPVNR